jgi:hypothetical protein
MRKYEEAMELLILDHYSRLTEPLKRQYAYLEAKKLGWGGQTYIRGLLGITYKTIRKGGREVENPTLNEQIPVGRQRRRGGGRKKICPVP